jgi:hypothetical protein
MYNGTAATEDSSLDKHQPTSDLSESSQLVLCQGYHSVSSIRTLNENRETNLSLACFERY